VIQVTRDRRWRNVLKLTSEWPERTKYLTAQLPYLAASHLREEVEGGLPTSSEWKDYRESLEVVEARATGKQSPAFAVRAFASARRLSRFDASKVVLYVEIRKRMRRVPPELSVLARFSPWTVSTLPFSPNPSEARVISRKVSTREVRVIERDRLADETKWGPELQRAGIRKERDPKKRLKGLKVLPDRLFEALRLEFGLGGQKSVPAWRRGLSTLRGTGVSRLARKDVTLARAFLDPRWDGWKRDARNLPVVSVNRLRRLGRFQRMLGSL
jgi:hypothetical protein